MVRTEIHGNYNFKLLSLNARGIRDFLKRKSIFTWVKQQNADIVFFTRNLQ